MLRSEWTKFWSVRSTWWVLGVLVVGTIGFGLIFAASATANPAGPSVTGSETMYASGEIRTSLLAAPNRWHMLAAKAVVAATVGFALTFVATYVAMLCGWPFARSIAGITDDRFTGLGLRVMAGAGLAIAIVALMSLGIGVLVRNTALAILIVVMLTFVLPAVFQSVPVHWMQTVSNYIIANSTNGLTAPPTQVDPANGIMSFGKSLWVSALWAVVPLASGAVVLRIRNA